MNHCKKPFKNYEEMLVAKYESYRKAQAVHVLLERTLRYVSLGVVISAVAYIHLTSTEGWSFFAICVSSVICLVFSLMITRPALSILSYLLSAVFMKINPLIFSQSIIMQFEYENIEGTKDREGRHQCYWCKGQITHLRATSKTLANINCANCGKYWYTTIR